MHSPHRDIRRIGAPHRATRRFRSNTKGCSGSASWKWGYNIDHERLRPGFKIRVTSEVFHPSKPVHVVSTNGSMPVATYRSDSPMYILIERFSGVKIEDPAPMTYCEREEQAGKTFWRLMAVGIVDRLGS